jgi:hypothetical protein
MPAKRVQYTSSSLIVQQSASQLLSNQNSQSFSLPANSPPTTIWLTAFKQKGFSRPTGVFSAAATLHHTRPRW